jgi:hypothetical protein
MPSSIRPLTAKQEHWRRHLEACRQGGGTIAEYAARHHLSPAQLYTWRGRLKQLGVRTAGPSALKRAHNPPPRASFSAVRLVDHSGPSTGELRIRFANGVVLEIADSSAWRPDSNLLSLLASFR